MDRSFQALVALSFLLAGIATSGFIYIANPLALHQDSFDHLALAKIIRDDGKLVYRYPYGDGYRDENPLLNPEPGFHVWLASLLVVTNLHETLLGAILPSIITFLLATGTFVFARRLFGSGLAGVFCAIAVVGMRSSRLFLGPQFLVPMAVGTALIPFNLFFFIKAWKQKRFIVLSGITFFASALIHPVYAIILLPAFALLMLSDLKKVKRNAVIFLGGGAILLYLSRFFATFLKINPNQEWVPFLLDLLSRLRIPPWRPEERLLEISGYSNLLVVGLAGAGVCAVALIVLAKVLAALSKKGNRLAGLYNEKMPAICLYAVFMAALFLEFRLSGFSFLAPGARVYQAVGYFVMLFAGFGLYALFRFAESFGSMKEEGPALSLVSVAFAIVLAFAVFSTAISMDAEKLGSKPGPIDLEFFSWVDKNVPKEGNIYVFPVLGKAFYLETLRRPSITEASRMGQPPETIPELFDFPKADCAQKEKTMKKYSLAFAHSYEEIDCENFGKVYSYLNQGLEQNFFYQLQAQG
ncbi:MAG: hypothetical protein HY394_04830 [Candidatus Diapherotrites archaeon]|nr:hypothetical protein [Candidatus Diapherotrites archaeon]